MARKEFNGIAAVLNFLLPGLGHLFAGHIFGGLFWFALTAVGYLCFVVPGIVLHFLCVVRGGSLR